MTQKHIRTFALAIVVMISLAIHSCQPKQDHSSAIVLVDSLIHELEKQAADMNAISILNERPIDSANIRLQYVQENFVGTMKKDMALDLSAYASTYRAELFMKQQLDTLEIQSDSILSELKSLKQALSEKATHDKNNNEITTDYVSKTLAMEMQNVSSLKEEIADIIIDEEKLREKLNFRAPKVQHWMDSIATKRLK